MYSRASILLITSLIFGIVSIFGFNAIASFKVLLYGIDTTAAVSAVHQYHKKQDDGSKSTMYQPEITYSCNNSEPITKQVNFSSSIAYYTGEQLKIKCNPNIPSETIIIGTELIGEGIIILFTVILAIYGVINLIKAIVLTQKKQRLIKTGERIIATIGHIRATGISMNKRHGYKIKAYNEFNTFTSEEFLLDPSQYINIGDKVPVYINITNPDDYWVDVENRISTKKQEDIDTKS